MFRRVMTLWFVAVLLIVVGGNVSVRSGVKAGDRGDALQSLKAPETLDDQFASIAKQVPAFGGLFYDEMGQLTMYLVESEPNLQEAVDLAIEAFRKRDGRITSADLIRVLPGQYSFLQLKQWHDRLFVPVFSIQGVILTDVDEATNRLRIGVESLEIADQVEEELAQLGIPREAVIIEETEPIVFMATLRDRVRPLRAGLQINFSQFLCTLGFNAVRQGVNGFVTCSHCTDRQGGVESTSYYQPSASLTNFIGTETVDPNYFRGGVCPRGAKCRYSDSAFAELAAGVTSTLGAIEQTGLGSMTITGGYQITGEVSAPLVGERLDKVGRTTGRSEGAVAATCVTTGVQGSNIVQICQDFVNASVAGGDSGSPVFKITSGSNVQLYGILWGGNQSGTQFVFSRMGNIERSGELGLLTTF
ncbi:MAG: hypothetical protein HY314_11560 [Acidobacteria bacterium]|nr:hypothetical protein [Acidobacteriota bacterium]